MAAPMTCKECGVTMNHHAEKLVDPLDAHEAGAMDMRLGGVLEEVHACPGCGRESSRRGE